MFCTRCGTSVEGGTFCSNCGAPAGGGSAPAAYAPAPALTPRMDYAPWATRALGYIIDSVLVGVVMGVLWAMLGALTAAVGSFGSHDMASGMCCVAIGLGAVSSLLVGLYNRVYLVSKRGASIGQGVVKVKVVDANGGLLKQNTALIRLLAQIGMGLLPVLPLLDLLWPLWDERRQTLHDKAVGCYVINNPAGV
jgi:uncharacterized RDD family membrane protein YckC